jgi:hypothetical protein
MPVLQQHCKGADAGDRGRAAAEVGLRSDHTAGKRRESTMAKIFMQHPVADYEKWRPIFDEDAPRREASGLTGVRVLRDADDPRSVWLVADGDPAKVEEMLQDPELGKTMQEAGVTAPPQLFAAT